MVMSRAPNSPLSPKSWIAMLVCIANALCHITTVHHHLIVCHMPIHPPFNGTNQPPPPTSHQVSISQSISQILTNEIDQSASHLQYHPLWTIQSTHSKATSSPVILLRVNSIYMWFLYRNFIFYSWTKIQTWTEPSEPESWCSGYGSRFSGPNLEVPIQILAKMSQTRTGLDHGQSICWWTWLRSECWCYGCLYTSHDTLLISDDYLTFE